ncbi:MAG TPA: KGG domain-containing protein [Candidatus Saccharibacteria bacterium]|nr:KGG domain-containing protein [Candidatus Saccharibacteria bacterium]
MGAKGGKAKTAKGFAKNRDLARAAGRKGGKAKRTTA